MRYTALPLLLAVSLFIAPGSVWPEQWVGFHTETWSHNSVKLKKKLHFSSHSYFDADSISRAANGDVTVWIRDISHNDRYYVGKGVAEKEVVYKQVHLRCNSGRYEVLLGDGGVPEGEETVSEEIKPGSAYEKLFKRVCSVSQ